MNNIVDVYSPDFISQTEKAITSYHKASEEYVFSFFSDIPGMEYDKEGAKENVGEIKNITFDRYQLNVLEDIQSYNWPVSEVLAIKEQFLVERRHATERLLTFSKELIYIIDNSKILFPEHKTLQDILSFYLRSLLIGDMEELSKVKGLDQELERLLNNSFNLRLLRTLWNSHLTLEILNKYLVLLTKPEKNDFPSGDIILRRNSGSCLIRQKRATKNMMLATNMLKTGNGSSRSGIKSKMIMSRMPK